MIYIQLLILFAAIFMAGVYTADWYRLRCEEEDREERRRKDVKNNAK